MKACNDAFIAAIRSSCLSDEDFQREYCCEPAKLAQLIGPEEYDRCILPPPYDVVPDTLDGAVAWGELFVGGDCGRKRNRTAVAALQRGYDKLDRACYRLVALKIIRDADFPTQYAAILPIISNEYIAKGFIDQGTQGRALADAVADKTGNRIEAFGMSAPRMGEMAELLRAFVQMQRISMPRDAAARRSVLCVRRKVHQNGRTLTYGGETDDGDHGDTFWALALALYAAEGGMKSRMMLPDQTGLELEELQPA